MTAVTWILVILLSGGCGITNNRPVVHQATTQQFSSKANCINAREQVRRYSRDQLISAECVPG